MYLANASTLSGLGFSLKPPKWLRNAVRSVGQATSDSVSRNAAVVSDQIRNTQVSVTQKPSGGDIPAMVQDNVPGGWGTIAALGAVALFVLPKLLRKGR